jgi:chromosome partitioning protein
MSLVGLAEIADLLGVTKQVVANWRSRKPDFPAPVVNLKSGPVWQVDTIAAWARNEGINVRLAEPPVDGAVNARAATVVAMMNMKGGVGKSTLTANIGWYAGMEADLRVLLIDLDPQFNLSQYVLGVSRYEALLAEDREGVEAIFRQAGPGVTNPELRDLIVQVNNWSDGSCLHLIPAKLELAWSMRFAVEQAHALRDGVAEIRDEYDLIIIDCSPTESILSWSAYFAADYIVVPVRPEFLSTIGLPLLLRSLEQFRRSNRNVPVPEIAGIVFNDTGEKVEHDRSRNFVRGVADENNIYVFENEVSHSESYPAGARVGKPIMWTDNARDWKKSEFRRVAREFLEKVRR